MLTPQATSQAPNTLYASSIVLGMSLNAGKPVGVIRSVTLQPAYVDGSGNWQNAGQPRTVQNIQFGFDGSGNVTGLPADIASLAPQVATAWADIVTVIGGINAVRKLV